MLYQLFSSLRQRVKQMIYTRSERLQLPYYELSEEVKTAKARVYTAYEESEDQLFKIFSYGSRYMLICFIKYEYNKSSLYLEIFSIKCLSKDAKFQLKL